VYLLYLCTYPSINIYISLSIGGPSCEPAGAALTSTNLPENRLSFEELTQQVLSLPPEKLNELFTSNPGWNSIVFHNMSRMWAVPTSSPPADHAQQQFADVHLQREHQFPQNLHQTPPEEQPHVQFESQPSKAPVEIVQIRQQLNSHEARFMSIQQELKALYAEVRYACEYVDEVRGERSASGIKPHPNVQVAPLSPLPISGMEPLNVNEEIAASSLVQLGDLPCGSAAGLQIPPVVPELTEAPADKPPAGGLLAWHQAVLASARAVDHATEARVAPASMPEFEKPAAGLSIDPALPTITEKSADIPAPAILDDHTTVDEGMRDYLAFDSSKWTKPIPEVTEEQRKNWSRHSDFGTIIDPWNKPQPAFASSEVIKEVAKSHSKPKKRHRYRVSSSSSESGSDAKPQHSSPVGPPKEGATTPKSADFVPETQMDPSIPTGMESYLYIIFFFTDSF
jgi:hypothetical protein